MQFPDHRNDMTSIAFCSPWVHKYCGSLKNLKTSTKELDFSLKRLKYNSWNYAVNWKLCKNLSDFARYRFGLSFILSSLKFKRHQQRASRMKKGEKSDMDSRLLDFRIENISKEINLKFINFLARTRWSRACSCGNWNLS